MINLNTHTWVGLCFLTSQVHHHGSWWFFTSVKPTSRLVLVFPHLCPTSSYKMLLFHHLAMKAFSTGRNHSTLKFITWFSQVSEFWIFMNRTMLPYACHYKPRLVHFLTHFSLVCITMGFAHAFRHIPKLRSS